MTEHFRIKLATSLGATGVIVARLIWPQLKIDAITLGLIIVAVLPWLSSLIESARFPGGWEIKFRNLESAAEKVIQEAPPQAAAVGPQAESFRFWAEPDPNLALVALRIEIERRIRALSSRAGIPEDRSMIRLFNRLREMGVLQAASVSGLQELLAAGNRAAHGATVEPEVANWAREYGPQIIAVLDARLQHLQNAG